MIFVEMRGGGSAFPPREEIMVDFVLPVLVVLGLLGVMLSNGWEITDAI